MDNLVDSWCFACGHLNEDTHHVLRCISDDCQEAREKATNEFNVMLSKYHTPWPMADLIINSIEQWSADQQVSRSTYLPCNFNDKLDQELHSCILAAFDKQTKIGWAHFLCRWISQAWKSVIAHYCWSREPGKIYSPDLWMQKAIKQTCTSKSWSGTIEMANFMATILKSLDKKQLQWSWREAQEVFIQTEGNVTNSKACLLHWDPIGHILNWTKAHLDAYLVTAEVIWNRMSTRDSACMSSVLFTQVVLQGARIYFNEIYISVK